MGVDRRRQQDGGSDEKEYHQHGRAEPEVVAEEAEPGRSWPPSRHRAVCLPGRQRGPGQALRPLTARALDALVEGLSLHDSFDAQSTSQRDIAATVKAVAALNAERRCGMPLSSAWPPHGYRAV